ncbi:MAG: hypothetical protein RXR03_09155, partial [Thermocladium sp.]
SPFINVFKRQGENKLLTRIAGFGPSLPKIIREGPRKATTKNFTPTLKDKARRPLYTHGGSLAIYGGDEENNFKYLMFLFF